MELTLDRKNETCYFLLSSRSFQRHQIHDLIPSDPMGNRSLKPLPETPILDPKTVLKTWERDLLRTVKNSPKLLRT